MAPVLSKRDRLPIAGVESVKKPIEGEVTWARHDLMGISVAVAFHYLTGEFHVFMDDNIAELPALLQQANVVSGFNIIGFDVPLVNATVKQLSEVPMYTRADNIYDLLLESRIANGWRHGDKFPSGMKLDDHLRGTFGQDAMKTANGAEAPLMWKRGELGKLISYCIDDVKRECMLFERAYAGIPLKTEIHGWAQLRNPNCQM